MLLPLTSLWVLLIKYIIGPTIHMRGGSIASEALNNLPIGNYPFAFAINRYYFPEPWLEGVVNIIGFLGTRVFHHCYEIRYFWLLFTC